MEAVHFLYARFAPDVHSGVRDFVPDDDEARTVTESVFGELPTLMVDYGYEPGKQPFASWLRDAARSVAQGQHPIGQLYEGPSRREQI